MPQPRLSFIRGLTGVCLGLALCSGCQYWPTAPAPEPPLEFRVKFDSPASGMEVQEGDRVALQVTATNPTGVSWIELWMDGEQIATVQAPTPPWPRYSVVHRLEASVSGEHLIEARAFDEQGAASPTTSLVLRVKARPAGPSPTATRAPVRSIPTITPWPTATLTVTVATAVTVTATSIPAG
jgi:hypothetical protein